VAASRRPSFLKRQKEQARLARATEKREARRARKHAKNLTSDVQDTDLGADMPENPDDQPGEDESSEEEPR
jgi:hypothetical protein